MLEGCGKSAAAHMLYQKKKKGNPGQQRLRQ